MVIGLNTNYNVNSHQVLVRRKQASFSGEEKKQGSATGTAVKGAAIGATAGLITAAAFKKEGLVEKVKAGNLPTVEQIKEMLNAENISSALKRTLNKASVLVQKIAGKSGDTAKSLEEKAVKLLNEGTKPYAKGALVGAVVGMIALLGLRGMSNKKDANAVESLKPIS